ncbi:MAG: UDP-N-acetylglucosamine 1-carboxyvinyltransferase [Thermoanaerobaculia bacterium]|nr:UDP-N-acetylglucosamine 1-carboxyvinyltransferase [Thermoanaerobaculia bacterium]
MDRLRIEGPTRLAGSIRAGGAKNAALPALAASLLCSEPIELLSVPDVRDVRTMLRLLEHFGVASERGAEGVTLRPGGEPPADDAPYELVKTMRASVLALGPLLARLGHARVSLPGGCAIGVRPIDQHLAGLEALGAHVELEHGYVTARAPRLRGGCYRFDMPTVTGTENLIMAATLATGSTRLENCAREPEVADLAALLSRMGARIEGAGTATIEIEGVDSLGGARHRIIPDRIEAGTYLIGGAMTAGEVRVENAEPSHLGALLEVLDEVGCQIDAAGPGICLVGTPEITSRDVATAPHPGFPTDLQAQYMALMTRTRGASIIRETVFENRFQHVPELARMGAEISIEGGRAEVRGPTELSGANVMATDLRASASLVLAGLAAVGTTVVDRVYHLDRGYEAMESKLQLLGARVERLRGD